MISTYMDEKLVTTSNQDKLFFYRTIQLLSFARTRQFKQPVKINGEILNTFSFPLTEFAKQIGLHPLNSYQRKNLLEFFRKLQDLPLIYQWFSDSEFRSSIIFPIIRVTNQSSKYTKLIPGDIIMTGTPAGVSSVKKGDFLVAKIDGLKDLKVKIM